MPLEVFCVVNAVTVHYSKVRCLEYAELLNSQVPGFEERLKEGIAGMNNGKYRNPTVAAKVLNVRKPRSVSSCSIDHIVSRYHA